MIKRISFFVSSVFFIALVTQFVTLQKATAAAPNQTETTTTTIFNIRGGNGNDASDANGKPILRPTQKQGHNVISLDASLNGRTAELPVGTVIFLHFPTGQNKLSINPAKGVVEGTKGKYHLPKGDIALLQVVGQGSATITVITKAGPGKRTTNSASTSNNWSGYARTSGGPFTDATSYWTVPTASSCSSGDTYSSAWIGIDGATNSDLIQTGTESDCVSGSPFYQAWWEILPAAEQPITGHTVNAGDSMFAEIKKNSTDWTITIKDLTQNWTYSPPNQTYSGSQSSTEWILEAPTVSGSTATLTHYGSTAFTHDTQNGANPQHAYSTDSIDMVDGSNNNISTTSYPNGLTDAFAVQYGASQPASPSEWNITTSVNPTSYDTSLKAVSAYSANNVWAVGSSENANGTYSSLIEHWDGTSWTHQTSANPGGASNILYGVKALSATDIWAVGSYYSNDNTGDHALIEHSTDGGSTWSQDTSSYTGSGILTAIDGVSGDAWAVGEASGNALTLKLISGHLSSQSNVSPNSNTTLEGVSEYSSSDVWTVGENTNGSYNTVTMHYDGSSWTKVSSPNPGANGSILKGVVNLGSNNAWAVGYEDSGNGILTHWNGSSWSSATSLSLGSYSRLFAVTALSSNNIWAVGYYSGGSLVWHSSDGGSTWHKEETEYPGSSPVFNGIAIDTATGNALAVGNYTPSSFQQTLIEQYSSTSHISLRSPASANNSAGASSLTLNVPSGTQNGDVMVAHVVVQTAGNSIAAPSGWNIIKRQDTSNNIATATYWKAAGSSEPSSYTWNFGTSGEASGGIGSYNGVNTTNPVDASNVQYNNGSTSVDNAGVTTTFANDMLVYAVGIVSAAPTLTVPTGFTEEWSTSSTAQTTSEMSQELSSSAGATGTIHGTLSSTYSTITHLIALRPAGASFPTSSSGISLRSSTTSNNGAGSSSLTISKPSNIQSGDVIVAQLTVHTAGNSIAAPSGWSLVLRQDTSSSLSTASYIKVATSSEPSSYTWTFGTSGEASGGIGSYIGVDTTTPIDARHAQYNSGTSNVDNSGVTTTTANDMLIYAVGIIIPTDFTLPSGFTDEWYAATNSQTTSEMSQKIDTSTGATGTIHGSLSIGNYSSVTHLIALRPANAPTPTPPSGISLRSQAANNNGGGSSSLTLNVPQGTTSGDVMVAHVAVRSAGNTITAPSGWTQVVRQDTSSSLSTVAYEKVAGSSEPSSYTWSFGTSGEASGAIGSYIGVNTTNPVDVSHGQYNSATNNVDNTGVTTTAANDMLVYAVGVVQATTVNPPSGFTEGSYTASNSLTTSEISQEIASSTGATGTIHGTENGGSTFSNVTLLIALKAQ